MEGRRFVQALLISLVLHAAAVAVVLLLPPASVPAVPPPMEETSVRISFSDPVVFERENADQIPEPPDTVQSPVGSPETSIPQVPSEAQSVPEDSPERAADPVPGKGSAPPPGNRLTTVEPPAGNTTSGSENSRSDVDSTVLVLDELNRRLAREHVYPRAALRRGWEGEVLLLLRLNSRGESEELSVLRSSGRSLLDEAALKLVRGILPVSTPLTSTIRLEIPVSYRLN